MATAIFEVDRLSFGAKALRWAQQFEQFCYLQSNDYTDDYSSIEALLAVSASDEFKATNNKVFHDLEQFRAKYPNQWVLGFFSYDLKNELENLSTTFSNPLDFPSAYFFVPTTVIKFIGTTVEIEASAPEQIYQSILNLDLDKASDESKMPYVQVKNRMSKDEYFNTFEKMMSHIKRGDIYEVNLCQEFYAENTIIDPILTYERLNEVSPTPFSAFFKIKDKYIICASPERFLAKRGRTLISQPIKGTAPRGKSMLEDEEIKTGLKNNPKEIAENIMIVDLVRNDMTQSAEAATVTAEKILEVQSFKQVHQLVSTITATQRDDLSDVNAIKNLFPPGSMTGAPKVSAMHLCDSYENSRRGVYAGTMGYFAPNGDFDFNVVIRTIIYNHTKQYLSFHTGGALTYNALAEDEYNECLLKASAITAVLNEG